MSAAWARRMCAMNSSVTDASAISVMSSLCLAISPSSRSNGPSKLSRCTSNGVTAPRRVRTPPGVTTSPLGSTRDVSVTANAWACGGVRPPHRGRSARGRAGGRRWPPRAATRYVVIGSAARDASGNFTVRLMTVWNTWSPKWSTTERTTSRLCRVRLSYMVARMPSTWSRGLSRSVILSIVSTSRATPRIAKNSHSSGMITPCAAVSALTVSRPSDGWQSMRTTS